MIDYERFDEWVAIHDNDKEAIELSRVVVESVVLAGELLGSGVAAAVGRLVVHSGMESAYGETEADEALAHLEVGDPISALEQLFSDVDLLNFQFAQKANGLKCFAMTGMIEGEDPTASFAEKRDHLYQLIEWGRMICDMVPEQRNALPEFRSICAAAEARFAIDLDNAVDVLAFAHLAALFREGTPEQVRKTLQNQISAKQLSVNERREILPESALSFLKGIRGFPSIWMLSEQPTADENELRAPTFIPVCPATFSGDERPFLPSERHPEGYRVGAGATAVTFDNYWQALDWLSQQPVPTFQPVGQSIPVRCKPEWVRVDRQLLLNELASVPSGGDGPMSLTEQVLRRIMKNSALRVHPLGHTSKLYRFQANDGSELALEKRIGEPWLYVRNEGLPPVSNIDYVDVAPTKQGRNSNLNALPTFFEQPLRKFKLTSIANLDAVMSIL